MSVKTMKNLTADQQQRLLKVCKALQIVIDECMKPDMQNLIVSNIGKNQDEIDLTAKLAVRQLDKLLPKAVDFNSLLKA